MCMPFHGSAYFQVMNTRDVRTNILNRYLNGLSLNMYIVVIPYTKILERKPSTTSPMVEHEFVHGQIVSLSPSSITVKELGQSPTSEPLPSPRRIPFDYALYALGSHLPAPINLWGPVPSQSFSSSAVKDSLTSTSVYSGFKPEGIEWLQKHQTVIKESQSILVVGGGPLGIRKP